MTGLQGQCDEQKKSLRNNGEKIPNSMKTKHTDPRNSMNPKKNEYAENYITAHHNQINIGAAEVSTIIRLLKNSDKSKALQGLQSNDSARLGGYEFTNGCLKYLSSH